MVLSYVCTEKCFFQNRIFNPGDKVILEEHEGDNLPCFVKDPVLAPIQADMQKGTGSPSSKQNDILINNDNKTKAPASKAGAKAVNGGKAK